MQCQEQLEALVFACVALYDLPVSVLVFWTSS